MSVAYSPIISDSNNPYASPPAPVYCEVCETEVHSEWEIKNEVCFQHHCEGCGEKTDDIRLVAETEGYCPDCDIYCDLCGQEHNASRYNGYCQHCKEPVVIR